MAIDRLYGAYIYKVYMGVHMGDVKGCMGYVRITRGKRWTIYSFSKGTFIILIYSLENPWVSQSLWRMLLHVAGHRVCRIAYHAKSARCTHRRSRF